MVFTLSITETLSDDLLLSFSFHFNRLAAQATSTTTSPPWLVTSQPSVWGTSTIRYPTTARIPLSELESLSTTVGAVNKTNVSNNQHKSNSNSNNSSSSENVNNNGRKSVTKLKTTKSAAATTVPSTTSIISENRDIHQVIDDTLRTDGETASVATAIQTTEKDRATGSTTLATTVAKQSPDNDQSMESKQNHKSATQSTVSMSNSNGAAGVYSDDSNAYFCGPTTARNLFWNFTHIDEVNVQPCPGGATGIAKWRCVASNRFSEVNQHSESSDSQNDDDQPYSSGSDRVMWQPATPDLTQCRSLWLNNLEVRVNQEQTPLIPIANDLSQVTNSKTLYGGDMLVTTKIIQMMAEKMTYNIENIPDERSRELIVVELLNGVVKTGSNLLDETQHFSWLDLSFEDQMRVATSLLTGLENNAFLLADTIAAERNIVQKAKNICELIFDELIENTK